MNIQKITLQIFFPAMYFCAGSALIAIWLGGIVPDSFFRVIPTFFVIGLASLITWVILIIKNFLDILRNS